MVRNRANRGQSQKRWGVTQAQLTAAHRKVGRLRKDIAAELGKKR
ncbi:DUF3606 domain-containing protein [Methylorubrum thiocyanatum]